MRFRGRIAVVTGAASGFGEAISRRLAREGAEVVLAAILSAVAAVAEVPAAEPTVAEIREEEVIRLLLGLR